MPQSCAANACLLTEEEAHHVMLILKKSASLACLPTAGFHCDVSLICLLKHLCGCLMSFYSPTLSCPPSVFGTSASVPDLLAEGSPPLAARGEGAEIMGEHKGHAEVLPSPLLTLHGIDIAGFYKSPPSIFAFMGVSPSLVRAERTLHSVNLKRVSV